MSNLVSDSQKMDRLGISAETIRGYDARIPRYTSYPTAPFWTEAVGGAAWAEHLERASSGDRPLSLYVHIPFCRKRCLFCACNVIVTAKDGIADNYLDGLESEIAFARERWHGRGSVLQLHLGGGTPNYLSGVQMTRVVEMLKAAFPFGPEAERSIEVDPRIASPEEIEELAQVNGFRRISFGVQDFSPETQAAIGRGQTLQATFDNARAARESGFKSLNIDLIYGLPRQTIDTWRETVETVSQLRPDRIALYNFAYLPGKLAHQRAFEKEELPSPALKVEMFMMAHDRLTSEGWRYIGMDHYALETDSLTRALDDGTLRRNFMGYTTLRGTDLLGFGVSAISDFQNAFAQNTKKLSEYHRHVDAGQFPTERGLILSEDDVLRRDIIETLMTTGVLWLAGEPVRRLVQDEAPRLEKLEREGLIVVGSDAVRVSLKGRVFLRNIAVVFDAYLKKAAEKPLFSRSV